MNNFLKLKFLIFKSKWYLLIFLISGIYSYFINKEIELILFFISYVFLRYEFPKTYHNSNFYKCIFWSIVMMILSVYVLLPRNVSLISSVPIAFLVDYVLFRIQDYIDLKNLKPIKKEFDINNCTKYALIKRCKKVGLSKNEIEIAIKMFYEKLTIKELADYLGIEPQSANNKKYNLKKKILK